jgi:hypothetical protein
VFEAFWDCGASNWGFRVFEAFWDCGTSNWGFMVLRHRGARAQHLGDSGVQGFAVDNFGM